MHWYHDNNRLGVHLGVFTGRRFSYKYVENLSKQTYLYDEMAAYVPLHALATSLHSQAYSRKNLGTRPASAPTVETGPVWRLAPMRGRETVAMNNALAKAAELHDMLARDHALLGRLRLPPTNGSSRREGTAEFERGIALCFWLCWFPKINANSIVVRLIDFQEFRLPRRLRLLAMTMSSCVSLRAKRSNLVITFENDYI